MPVSVADRAAPRSTSRRRRSSCRDRARRRPTTAVPATRRRRRSNCADRSRILPMCSDDFRPTLLPCLARVGRLVDAVAEVRAALARVLARADPDDVRILRIDDDAAEREGALLVEDRRERDAAVGRLPQAAERGGHVPDARVLRIDLDVLDAAGRERGPEAAELEALQRLRIQGAGRLARQRRRADAAATVEARVSGFCS